MEALSASGEQALLGAAAMDSTGMSASEQSSLYAAIQGPLLIQSPIQVRIQFSIVFKVVNYLIHERSQLHWCAQLFRKTTPMPAHRAAF
jgi:hypothetical protein